MPSRKQSTIEQYVCDVFIVAVFYCSLYGNFRPLNGGLTNALKLAEKEAKMKTVKREERYMYHLYLHVYIHCMLYV